MASAEHLKLSDYIKSVHENLRNETRVLGSDEAWQKHSKDEHTLLKYASAMRELATKHWESKPNSSTVSRIKWIYKVCCDYFNGDDLQKYREREEDIAGKIEIEFFFQKCFTKPYRLLDVGSCYNPFSIFSEFCTTAIDIAPATDSVHKCDFLNVATTPYVQNKCKERYTNFLLENYYDVVVFSLVLEYLPTAQQRLLFCEKAYRLLKPEGLLCIITPDSKHVGANCKIMKTWKYLLANIGFSRIRYEKLPHIHCMAFRKSIDCRITQRWARLHPEHNYYDSFVIPQDFNETQQKEECKEAHSDIKDNTELLLELPFFVND